MRNQQSTNWGLTESKIVKERRVWCFSMVEVDPRLKMQALVLIRENQQISYKFHFSNCSLLVCIEVVGLEMNKKKMLFTHLWKVKMRFWNFKNPEVSCDRNRDASFFKPFQDFVARFAHDRIG